MKRNAIILFVGILLTSILLTGTAIAVDDSSLKDLNVKISSFNTVKSNDNVKIIVKVTDKDTKENIVRANVHLSIPGIIDSPGRTNGRGKVSFRISTPKLSIRTTKTITVTASATGYNTATKTKQITIKPAIEGITLKLKMPKTVKEGQIFFARAIVIDKATKQRVPGATVVFRTPGGRTRQVTTNNQGVAKISELPRWVTTATEQEVTATATYNEYTATKSRTILVTPTHTNKLEINAYEVHSYPKDDSILAYRYVVSADGEGVPGAKVVVVSSTESGRGPIRKFEGYTNQNGAFIVSMPRVSNKAQNIRQKVVITATKEGYTGKTRTNYFD